MLGVANAAIACGRGARQGQWPKRITEGDERARLDRVRRSGDGGLAAHVWRRCSRGHRTGNRPARSGGRLNFRPRDGSSGSRRARRGRSRRSASRSRRTARPTVRSSENSSPCACSGPPWGVAIITYRTAPGEVSSRDGRKTVPPMSRRSILLRLVREARPYYPRLAIAMAMGVFAGVLSIVPPLAFRIIINRVLVPRPVTRPT